MVELPLGCSAFGMSMSFPPYYQDEERFEKKNTIAKLMENNQSDWAELWEPIVKWFPEVTLRKIPEILKPIEKIGFEQLKAKIDTVGETGTEWITSTRWLMSWSTVIGTWIFLASVILVVQTLIRCQKWRMKNKVLASALLGEIGEPIGVLFKKDEIEPSVDSNHYQPTNYGREKGCP